MRRFVLPLSVLLLGLVILLVVVLGGKDQKQPVVPGYQASLPVEEATVVEPVLEAVTRQSLPPTGADDEADEDGPILDLDDPDMFAAFVSALPAWSAGDERFEEKYRGVPATKLEEARDLLGALTREDRAPWIAQRMTSGDYIDITGEEGTIKHSRPGRLHAPSIEQVADGAEIKTYLFEFYEEEYPLVFYRVREMAWVKDRLRELGHE